ncbi:MarR family winged helix-turn-helix transcriptional regulator [Paenarthrobacter sp. NPDC090520]|uniref:MarR family winged helix-turn-helix transcriptional regulator n=1 Tax=Paenarthrobacter sp. NPDC090520 TaxID=3364382 RepID=UPI00380AA0B0
MGDAMGLLLAKLHSTTSALNNEALAVFGLRERSFSVLALACSGLEPTQRELADFLSLDPSQIVSLVDDLEGRGLIERTQGKRDRRAKIITGTPAGNELHENARRTLEDCEKNQLSAFTEGEVSQLRSLLKKALCHIRS